jgi:3-hydroxyisobutyrate dehydrogenase
MASANSPFVPTARPVGFISNDPGTSAIAERLAAAGQRVLHLMLDPAIRLAHAPRLEAAATVSDIAIECDTILLAIEDTQLLSRVLLGDEDRHGLAHDLRPGGLLIDLGMRPAREAQSLLGFVGMRGVSVVDAAILGARETVLRGGAKVLIGGFPDAVDAALAVLSELGSIERTGPLGSAQTAAALMGYVEVAHFAARADAISVGTALGLKQKALSQLFDETPDPENITRLQRRADFVRRLVEDRGMSGNVISFRRLVRPAEAS